MGAVMLKYILLGSFLASNIVLADDVELVRRTTDRRRNSLTTDNVICTVNPKQVTILRIKLTDGRLVYSQIIERPSSLDRKLLSQYASTAIAGALISEAVTTNVEPAALAEVVYSVSNHTSLRSMTLLETRSGTKAVNNSPVSPLLISLLDLHCWED